MNPRHNEEEIQLGIRLLKTICDDTTRNAIPRHPAVWSWHQCDGGGWKICHKMNKDLMTPVNVVRELDLKKIIKEANDAYNAVILKKVKQRLNIPTP